MTAQGELCCKDVDLLRQFSIIVHPDRKKICTPSIHVHYVMIRSLIILNVRRESTSPLLNQFKTQENVHYNGYS